MASSIRLSPGTGQRLAVQDDPRQSGHALTGPMGGSCRYRVGNYRAICDIQDDELRILVARFGGRDEVYR